MADTAKDAKTEAKERLAVAARGESSAWNRVSKAKGELTGAGGRLASAKYGARDAGLSEEEIEAIIAANISQ